VPRWHRHLVTKKRACPNRAGRPWATQQICNLLTDLFSGAHSDIRHPGVVWPVVDASR
jgi:hypothetical protein